MVGSGLSVPEIEAFASGDDVCLPVRYELPAIKKGTQCDLLVEKMRRSGGVECRDLSAQ